MWPGDSGLPGLRRGLALWASGFPDESVVARTEARFPPRAATSQKHPASWAQRPRPPAPPRPRPSEAHRRCRAPASPPGEPGSEVPHRLAAFPQTAARGQATPGEASRAWRPVRGRLHLGVPRGPKARAVFAQGGSLRAAGHRASPPAEPQIPLLTLQPGFHPLPAFKRGFRSRKHRKGNVCVCRHPGDTLPPTDFDAPSKKRPITKALARARSPPLGAGGARTPRGGAGPAPCPALLDAGGAGEMLSRGEEHIT